MTVATREAAIGRWEATRQLGEDAAGIGKRLVDVPERASAADPGEVKIGFRFASGVTLLRT